jgi:hypothetical protein
MPKDSRPRGGPQADEQFQEQLRNSPEWQKQQEQLRRLSNSPEWRKQQEQLRRLFDSPIRRRQQEQLGQLKDHFSREPQPEKPRPRRRKKGGGHPSSFTPEQIEQLRAWFQNELQKNPKLGKNLTTAAKRMQLVLPKDKRDPGLRNLLTLKRHVFWPVLGKNRSK